MPLFIMIFSSFQNRLLAHFTTIIHSADNETERTRADEKEDENKIQFSLSFSTQSVLNSGFVRSWCFSLSVCVCRYIKGRLCDVYRHSTKDLSSSGHHQLSPKDFNFTSFAYFFSSRFSSLFRACCC